MQRVSRENIRTWKLRSDDICRVLFDTIGIIYFHHFRQFKNANDTRDYKLRAKDHDVRKIKLQIFLELSIIVISLDRILKIHEVYFKEWRYNMRIVSRINQTARGVHCLTRQANKEAPGPRAP